MMSLAEFLSARGLSCAEFARTLGVRDTTVLRWTKGDREPTVSWAFAIEKATDGLVPASAWVASPELSPSSAGARKVRAAKGRRIKQAAAGQVRRKRRRSRKQTH